MRSVAIFTVIATKYQHTDALGSPVAVTNTAGTVIERNDYEPYGAVIGKPGYSGIGYTGHVMDGGTGLTYMQQRYYDQSIGRFLSVDPVVALSDPILMFNRYRYAANNPYRYTDPDGRCEGISTCQAMRDDMDVASGRMSRQEHADRINARGVGAAIGIAIVATRGSILRYAPALARVMGRSSNSSNGNGKIPEKIYRAAKEGNPNHVKIRDGQDAVSFRDSLSNPSNKDQATMMPGRNYIEVSTEKLPPGSVVADGGKTINGKTMPDGHISVRATPEEIVQATTGGGKLPKK